MDLDALAAARAAEWDRLEALGRQRRLSGAEGDELIERYQSAAADLSAIQSAAGQTAVGTRLSILISRARLRFAGAGAGSLGQLPGFFARQLPAALFRIRWLTVACAAAFVVVTGLYWLWVANSPSLMAVLSSEVDVDQLVNHDFVDYYSNYSGQAFTSLVWTNNAWVAATCIAFGILGVYGPYMIINNAMNVGVQGALLAHYGKADVFFEYISPHGQLELTCIFVACAAGLRIFWAWVAPGRRTRLQALGEEGRAMFTIVVGLAIALLVSGLIEGWVTRQDWPWEIKTGIGTVALAAFLVVQWVVGRRAHRLGQTGDLDEFEAGAKQLVTG